MNPCRVTQPRSRRILFLVCLLLAGGGSARAQISTAGLGDSSALKQLNEAYTKAFLASDVGFFHSLLTDDFVGVLADGRLIDRKEFLSQAALPPPVHAFEVHDPVIHVYGESAVVTAWVTYKRADETQARTRYIDLYVKVAGHWRMASVQWTRLAPLGH